MDQQPFIDLVDKILDAKKQITQQISPHGKRNRPIVVQII